MPEENKSDNSLRRPQFVESPSMLILAVLALSYTMYFGAFVLMPIAFAFVLGVVLTPIVQFLRVKMFIPSYIGAGILLLVIIAIPSAMLYGLAHPNAGWFAEGFAGFDQAERRVRERLEFVSEIRRAAERIGDFAAAPDDGETVVRVKEPGGVAGAIVDWTQAFIITGAIILVLVYFLLATEGLLVRKLIRIMPTWEDKKTAMEISEHVEADISRYLLTITAINILLGVTVALAMWALGMPSPVLWGILATLLNYIPYIGALAGVILAGIVAIVTFDAIPYALLVAGIYYALTGIEGNFIVPAVLGKRLYLNPVVVFLGLVYWGWVWGIPGALLAVPMLSIMKIVADNVKPLNFVGQLLGK